MFSRLLVGLDGSSGAEAALTAAIDLARRFKSTIVLAAITDVRLLEAPRLEASTPLWGEGMAALAPDPGLALAIEERGRRLVDAAAERVRAAGLAAEAARAVGFVDEELLALAGEAEAIVVGRRGELRGEPGTLGAVTAHIVRKSPKPVLVAGERPSPCERPVVAYDGGETSSNALALAARYADALQIRLDVVHVGEDSPAGAELLAKAGAFLSSRNVAYTTHLLAGDVVAAVADFVGRGGADLLVAGARGFRRRPWGLGSRAERLLRATTVPMIIVR